jgi:putative heme iron utilization protein
MVNAAPPPAPDFDAVGVAKDLLRSVRAGALATLDRAGGFPFASLVTVATDHDGSPLLLMSRLSSHTRNLEADARASILLARGGKGDPLAHPRLTVIGRAERTTDERARRRFLARQSKAALYAGFGDFSFWRLTVEAAHLNGGFARARDLAAGEVLTDLAGGEELLEVEASAIEHMNADHREALALYAEKLAGAPKAAWRATGLDPEGLDLMAGDRAVRVPFGRRITGAGELRRRLKQMADAARARES